MALYTVSGPATMDNTAEKKAILDRLIGQLEDSLHSKLYAVRIQLSGLSAQFELRAEL